MSVRSRVFPVSYVASLVAPALLAALIGTCGGVGIANAAEQNSTATRHAAANVVGGRPNNAVASQSGSVSRQFTVGLRITAK
jgi:hypothetical protein